MPDQERLNEILKALREPEERAVRLHWNIGTGAQAEKPTLGQIGEETPSKAAGAKKGVTGERIRQQEIKGLMRLRDNGTLDEFVTLVSAQRPLTRLENERIAKVKAMLGTAEHHARSWRRGEFKGPHPQ